MKEYDLAQGSSEWLEFRRHRRMSSESAAVMRRNPYCGVNQVRRIKQGLHHVALTPAMANGLAQEPLARELFTERTGIMLRPAVFADGDYACSLDGIDPTMTVTGEIKTPYDSPRESKRWLAAERGELLDHDMIQVQHGLMVTGAEVCHFMVYDWQEPQLSIVPVRPNPLTWAEIRAAWDEFWPSIERRDDDEWHQAATNYLESKKAFELAKLTLEKDREVLTSMVVGGYAHGAGVYVQRVDRAGGVDWKKVAKERLQDVDLDTYRKAGTSYYDVRIDAS